MRVTNVEENITHAVIGGMQAIDFGISENPEFFHILSSTLYKNQKLAVVRETLCNAWDAHIEAGKTDIAIKIVLTHEELIIEDFGLGIPHTLIGQVYGTYGNSTKKNDGRATGGFGLGCKSPFAYTDHFEVISCNGGVGTIYNLSKSNAEVGGKPGIIPITNYLTDHVGLKVTIPLKNGDDHYEFDSLIRQIVSKGGIKALYTYLTNAEFEIETLPFDQMQDNYLVSSHRIHDDTNIMVRYGNVLYPISVNDAYVDSFDEISNFLAALSGNNRSHYSGRNRNNSDWTIIFQAEPNSLTITPSREELSMQDYTIKTLTKILADFVEVLRAKVQNRTMPTVELAVRDCIARYDFKELFNRVGRLPAMSQENTQGRIRYYGSITGIIHAFVRHNYPNGIQQLYKELNARINGLIRAKYCSLPQLKAFKKMLKWKLNNPNLDNAGTSYMGIDQFARVFLKPLLKEMEKKKIPTDRLCIYQNGRNKRGRGYSYEYKPEPLNGMDEMDLSKAFSFLSNTVILTYTKKDIDEYLYQTSYGTYFGEKETALIYLVSKNEKEREAAKKMFYDRGYVVFDLTQKYEEEQDRIHALKEARKRLQAEKEATMEVIPEQKPGIRSMLSYIDSTYYFRPEYDEDYLNKDRVENPKSVIRLYNNRTNFSDCISSELGNETLGEISKIWGHEIGVCETTSKYEKMIRDGALPLEEYLVQKFEEVFTKDVNLARRIAVEYSGYEDKLTVKQSKILRFIKSDPELSQHFGIEAPLNTQESQIFYLWTLLDGVHCLRKQFLGLKRFVEKTPPNECMRHLIEVVIGSNNWELIDVSILPDLSQQSNKGKFLYPSTHSRVVLARKMILLVLKG